jgi:hypothetical protein
MFSTTKFGFIFRAAPGATAAQNGGGCVWVAVLGADRGVRVGRAPSSLLDGFSGKGLLVCVVALAGTPTARAEAIGYAAPLDVVRLAMGGAGVAWPGTAAPRYAVHIAHEETARSVRHFLDRARRRLSRSTCQGLLDDFADDQGRPLRSHLEATGRAAGDYLGLIIFYDGRRHPRCLQQSVIAVTQVGSRIVYICPRQFARYARKHPRWTEATLIHEALHTLGLGENPPPSREITSAVMDRCL